MTTAVPFIPRRELASSYSHHKPIASMPSPVTLTSSFNIRNKDAKTEFSLGRLGVRLAVKVPEEEEEGPRVKVAHAQAVDVAVPGPRDFYNRLAFFQDLMQVESKGGCGPWVTVEINGRVFLIPRLNTLVDYLRKMINLGQVKNVEDKYERYGALTELLSKLPKQ